MKILSVVGARPQFIKAAPVSSALRRNHQEILLHTGQHYDRELSAVFFEELGIPEPDYNLGVGSGLHGQQTGEMLIGIEEVLLHEKPDWVLVYGDTNSTLAGALAATKLHLPVAHVEAGLRSFNWQMPEEVNRVLTDRCAQLLFCPTPAAVANLRAEGLDEGVHLVGDVMYDALLHFLPRADQERVLAGHNVTPGDYILATIHRAATTSSPETLGAALACLAAGEAQVLLPLHPRTEAALKRFGLEPPENARLITAVSYMEMIALEKNAALIMTDSGGVQKEAYLLGVPCLTLREETEWVETVEAGWNRLVGVERERVEQALAAPWPSAAPPPIFGEGNAAEQISGIMEKETR